MTLQERRGAVLQGRKVRTKQIDVGEVAALNREAVSGCCKASFSLFEQVAWRA